MIIAIDGPAGSGKSTLAQALAKKLDFAYLDTGAMYRCVALDALDKSVTLSDQLALGDIADNVNIKFKNENGVNQVYLNDKCVTDEIRKPRIDNSVSQVAADPLVRKAMVKLQREYAKSSNVVCEGRDMGTVVFPHAEIKIFLTADANARADRRYAQQSKANEEIEALDPKVGKAEVLKGLLRRDEIDSTRADAPLKPAADAIHLDTTNMTVEQEVDFICKLIVKQTNGIAESLGKVEGSISNEATANNTVSKESSDSNTSPTNNASTQPQPEAEDDKQGKSKDEKKEVKMTKRTPKARPGSTPMKFIGNTHKDYLNHQVKDYPLHARIWQGFACTVAGAFLKIMWPWKIDNFDNFIDDAKKQGVVVIMNHGSNLDPLFPIISAYFRGVTLRPIYKSEFADHPVLRWIFMRGGGIPIHRHTADITAIRTAQRALQAGESILIFPEGTRVKEGEESVIHRGFALMAQLAGADVVPMAIVGARDVTPRGKFFSRPSRIYLKTAKPLSLSEFKCESRKEQLAQIEEVAVKEVFDMVDQLREEHPGKM